jgi:aminoglycoside phosphotransferase (APT) family kinase protein
MHLSLADISSRLQAFLEEETESHVRVEGARLLAGGASRAAIAVDITVEAWTQRPCWPAVLRLDLGGKIYESSIERDEEFQVLAHAARGGVPVPRPLWASRDPGILGRPFLVLERVEGETIGRRIVQLPELAGARRDLPAQMGRALARIHRLDPKELPFLRPPGPVRNMGFVPAHTALSNCIQEMFAVDVAQPALGAGYAWLSRHAQPCDEVVLVHGDFRLGNLIVGPEGLRAVLDWEFTTIGDPHEDLAWPFVRDWRFGVDRLRFAGLSDGEDFLAAYAAESGRAIDRERLRYWEVMGNFRWAVGCLTQANRHLSGAESSVELASLGRRSCEMKLEMLDLIAAIETERNTGWGRGGGADARPT